MVLFANQPEKLRITYILYGVDNRLPYEQLLVNAQKPIYNVDNYVDQHLKVFADKHKKVRENLLASRAEMMAQQHKRAIPVAIKIGDTVMVQVLARSSKLAPNSRDRPCLVVGERHGNKVEVFDPFLNTVDIIHSDRLKKKRATDTNLANNVYVPSKLPPTFMSNNTKTMQSYNLRSRT